MKAKGNESREKGAVAPLVAIMLILIVVCVALVVDLGHIHNVKIQLQRAVDAAALAGAQQLDGATGAVQGAKDVAAAVAAANRVDQESVIIVADDIELGTWDDEALGAPASSRFIATEVSPNAVKVTASRNVDHIFFWFLSSTDVTADAIAVATPEVPVLPLAIVTCIPSDKMLENPGSLPGVDVCDIVSYSFNPDKEDTTAWTSLTFNATASKIVEYMTTEEGREKFNQVVFGKGLNDTDGIENEPVDSAASPFSTGYGGCDPVDVNITCGLGRIAGKDLAAPGEFPIPPNLSDLSLTPGEPAPGFDPLTDYGDHINGALPRWYNLNNDASFGSDDHFTRVWSQDRILLPGESELDGGILNENSPYFDRLTNYANGSVKPYLDDRFLEGNFIIEPTGQLKQNLKDRLGFIPPYWPDFLAVANQAGYPEVGVINGSVTTVLKALIENEDVSDGTNLKCTDNAPFPDGEHTLRFNAPVIFAGSCENWKAISNESVEHDLVYIGLSKFLLTRAWTNQGEYDCGDESEVVQLHEDSGCNASIFDPPLHDDKYFSVPVPVKSSFKGLEGLTLVPVAEAEEAQASILKVYLVE